MAPCQRDIGAKRHGKRRILQASFTTGRANGLGTRTRLRLDGTGEIRLESADRAAGYWTTFSDTLPNVSARTSGVYLRADLEDLTILDGRDDQKRAELIAERLRRWESIRNA